ncbi:hypothetical protein [Flavobacterium sp. H122]|uniref:hypothetical protein n=1 Tax=Flavobacterium sp. H122 TaxID=2529860 RepID=UPI0010A9F732|nr:hypothetical protein [Flavobacterium sp. H122]
MGLLFQSDKRMSTSSQTGKKVFEVNQQQFQGGLLDKTLQYEMEVTLLGQSNNTDFGYEIDRRNLLIDNEEPNTVFEQLAFECGKAIFPLRFTIDKNGVIKQLYEYPKVVERWLVIKEQLLNYYEGDMAVNYIKCTDQNLKNMDTIKQLIKNQLFVYFFFNPLQNTVTEPLVWKTAPFMDFEGNITMLKATDSEGSGELVLQSDSPFININAKYTFDEKNKSIDSCNASIVQDNDSEIKLSFIAKQVEVLSN